MHRHHLRRNKHHSIHLQRAWQKHGEAAFVFSIIEHVHADELIAREQYYLDTLRPFGTNGYNIAPMAGSTRGVKRTPEQIERMAAINRGKKLSPEHRARISAAGRGRKHTEESIKKLREAKLKNNWQRGRPMNERQRAALLHQKGESHPWYGRSHSKETKTKLSEKALPVVQITKCGMIIRRWRSAPEAARALGLKHADSIYRAMNHGSVSVGSRWRRASPDEILCGDEMQHLPLVKNREPFDWPAILLDAQMKNMSAPALARTIGCSKSAVERNIQRLGLPKLRDGRRTDLAP